MTQNTDTKYQVQFQYDDHPKGPEFWQKSAGLFDSIEAAEVAIRSPRYNQDLRYRIVVYAKGARTEEQEAVR